MAAEIIPIELGLTAGNGVTLWAPRWQEDGEEWEAFLGHGDDLYVLPTAAHLAAFIRTSTEHDLLDHPEWETASEPAGRRAAAGRGPQLRHRRRAGPGGRAAGHLDARRAVRHDRDPALAGRGLRAGRDRRRARLRRRVRRAAARRAGVHRARRREAVERARRRRRRPLGRGAGRARRHRHHPRGRPRRAGHRAGRGRRDRGGRARGDRRRRAPPRTAEEPRDEDLAYWDETGIDCLEITVGGRTGWTLRCYLGDDPVFLSTDRPHPVFDSPAALENYLAEPASDHRAGRSEHLAGGPQTAIREGQAAVLAGPENTYQMDGLDREPASRVRRRSTPGSSTSPPSCWSMRPRSAATRRPSRRSGPRARWATWSARSPVPTRTGSHPPRRSTTRRRPGRCSSTGSPAPSTGTASRRIDA